MQSDLVLLDRGYPAAWLFNLILSINAHFCARVKVSQWKIIKKFFNSGKKEKIVKLPQTYPSIRVCKEMGLDTTDIRVLLIRIELPSGKTEILVTSLLDKDQFDIQATRLIQRHCPVLAENRRQSCRSPSVAWPS
ncbi:MAG: hypothetical protein KKC46_03855 [Proteobacteria bacterium]|nr:hypothetical protein [Pseudomonadota bacterium]